MEIWGGAEDLRVRNLKAVAEFMGMDCKAGMIVLRQDETDTSL